MSDDLAGFRVLVGTPAYGGMVHTSYMGSLFEFNQAGIAFNVYTLGNESLITRARNTVLSVFHARKEFTHLLFLDADVQLPASGLLQMLRAGEPVMGAPVALKGREADGRLRWNVGHSLGSKGTYLRVSHVGTAALLLSRAATDALVADAEAHGRVYAKPSNAQDEAAPDVQFDVFQVGVQGGAYLSEDYWVCQRLIQLGFDVLVDATVVTQHHGTVAF